MVQPLMLISESVVARFGKYLDKGQACWMWTGAKSGGRYGVMCVDGKRVSAHRLSWMIHHGVIPDGQHVLHKCDTPGCCNPEHLFLGNHAENMRDMEAKGRGRHLRGAQRKLAKLSESNVRDARALRSEGWKVCDLAKRYGVSSPCMSRVLTGIDWAHVV